MVDEALRIGRFTSSNAWKIAAEGSYAGGFTKAGITYIETRRAERCLGRSIEMAVYKPEMFWGVVNERIVFEKVGMEYSHVSKKTIVHKKYPFWSGTPDLTDELSKLLAEIKCFYPDKFFKLASLMINQDLPGIKRYFPQVYWQVVSNACLLNYFKGEIICYMPTLSELKKLRKRIDTTDFTRKILKEEEWKTRFIVENEFNQLPYIPDKIQFPSLNRFKFDIPVEDMMHLERRMKAAELQLAA